MKLIKVVSRKIKNKRSFKDKNITLIISKDSYFT